MAKVNIKQVAEYVAGNENITRSSAERIVNHAFAFIRDSIANGEDVHIKDFGNFTLAERAARTGRNPATGAEIEIPASRAVKFKPSASFKEQVK
jgi:nucleoid DNA-binding protein